MGKKKPLDERLKDLEETQQILSKDGNVDKLMLELNEVVRRYSLPDISIKRLTLVAHNNDAQAKVCIWDPITKTTICKKA